MVLARIFEVYGAGWMIAFALSLVRFYRKNSAGELFANIKTEIEKNPELLDHYENNIHGSRTKTHAYITLAIIAIAFALSSLWPFVVLLRTYHLIHHDTRDD
jgi:hypothetical protein